MSVPGPVGIVGLGVVGRTVADALQTVGIDVRGYDRDRRIGSPEDMAACSVVFVSVPTPPGPDGGLDVREVDAAMEMCAERVATASVVAIKSTVPPGTCDRLAARFPDLMVASVPEFLVQSSPLATFTAPDRVVIGTSSGEAAEILADLFRRVTPGSPVLVVSPIEAELVKLASNAMLSAKVSMANELAAICRAYRVSWSRIQGAVGLDHRIGAGHLSVTPEGGFDGPCLPKDLDGLISSAAARGHEATLLQAVASFNRRVRGEDTAPPESEADRAP